MSAEFWVDPVRQFHRTDCPYLRQMGNCHCGPVPRSFVHLDGSATRYTDDSVLPSMIAVELAKLPPVPSVPVRGYSE